MIKAISLAVLGGGILLLIFGINAYDYPIHRKTREENSNLVL